MSRPASRAASRPASRAGSQPCTSRTAHSGPGVHGSGYQDLQVNLKDCENLIRHRIVGLPGGFTKSGHPLILFPNNYRFNEVLESDLHLLLKYYVSVIPKNEQTPGFAIVIDRNTGTWQDIQEVFSKIISLFPASIKEVFLLYRYPPGGPMLGQLADDYLLDFDIIHVAHVTELLHYIDAKYLSHELGGSSPIDVDTWLNAQKHVDYFTVSTTKIARRLATFVRSLNKEDLKHHNNNEMIQEVAHKNRSYYRQLHTELEELTRQGVFLLARFEEEGANMMQRLAVQMLCYQLDSTWQYFATSFKIQDQLYVQHVELNSFQTQFRELAFKFSENEKIIRKLPVTGANLHEVNKELDRFDNVMEAFSIDVQRANNLSKVGSDLILEHEFARDSLEPKCTELRIMCKRQEILFLEKRQILLKFLDLFEELEKLSKWCSTATQHMNMDQDMDRDQDTLSQIRQTDYLLAKAKEMKIKSRIDFEEDFDDIRKLIAPKTLFNVGDKIKQFEEVKKEVTNRRASLREKAAKDPSLASSCDKTNRYEKVIEELIATEEKYVYDLHSVLIGYRDRLDSDNFKTDDIFGNMEEISEFHAQYLLPALERCGEQSEMIAKTFLDSSQDIKRIYCSYCQNMETARSAVASIGEDSAAMQVCQRELGHQLPLSSYLLKPVQRLTKYQLLIKELVECSQNNVSSKAMLEECLETMLNVIKVVNDSLHIPNLRGLPESLQPLGSLICQETFAVFSENKSQSQILFRNNKQHRHLLLYEKNLVFSKQIVEKGVSFYQFKFSMPVGNMGMSSIIKEEEKKMEVWIIGQPDAFTLEAKSKKAKDDFALELRKVIAKEKENKSNRIDRIVKTVVDNESFSATSGSECSGSRRSKFSRARSLDQEAWCNTYQARTMDRSSSQIELLDNTSRFPKYQILADYMALTTREVNLHQGDEVQLIKKGCAGWWYVRLTDYPFSEGWAPSTYLEKITEGNRTLDRF